MKKWTVASCISFRSTWAVKVAHSLLNAKPKKELWEVPCKKEASLEFLLLMPAGEKDQGLGTWTATLGVQWQEQEARAAPDKSQLSWNGPHSHLSTVRAGTARVPRCPAVGGSAPLPAGLQSGPHHVPQSPKIPHSPSGPERRPVKRYSLSWAPQKLLAYSLPSAEKKGEQLTGWRLRPSPLGETELLASGDPWP